MKIAFVATETLCLNARVEIECNNKQEVENALNKIGENVSFEDLENELGKIFGYENVNFEEEDSSNIYSADEYTFEYWDNDSDD